MPAKLLLQGAYDVDQTTKHGFDGEPKAFSLRLLLPGNKELAEARKPAAEAELKRQRQSTFPHQHVDSLANLQSITTTSVHGGESSINVIEVDITIHARGSIEEDRDLLIGLANMCGITSGFAEYDVSALEAEEVTFEHYVCVNIIFFLMSPTTRQFQKLQKQPLILVYHAYDAAYGALKALHRLTLKETCVRAGKDENADDIPDAQALEVWNMFSAKYAVLVKLCSVV